MKASVATGGLDTSTARAASLIERLALRGIVASLRRLRRGRVTFVDRVRGLRLRRRRAGSDGNRDRPRPAFLFCPRLQREHRCCRIVRPG